MLNDWAEYLSTVLANALPWRALVQSSRGLRVTDCIQVQGSVLLARGRTSYWQQCCSGSNLISRLFLWSLQDKSLPNKAKPGQNLAGVRVPQLPICGSAQYMPISDINLPVGNLDMARGHESPVFRAPLPQNQPLNHHDTFSGNPGNAATSAHMPMPSCRFLLLNLRRDAALCDISSGILAFRYDNRILYMYHFFQS